MTNKVVKTAVQIKKGITDKLELGNMDSSRDWGHSKDYVRAMNMIVNHNTPQDFIVATGETRTVRDLCMHVFGKLNMDHRDYVVQSGNIVIVDPDSDNEDEYLRQIAEALKQCNMKCVVSRGFGVFAVGRTFNEAWKWAAILEHSMQVLMLARQAGIRV